MSDPVEIIENILKDWMNDPIFHECKLNPDSAVKLIESLDGNAELVNIENINKIPFPTLQMYVNALILRKIEEYKP